MPPKKKSKTATKTTVKSVSKQRLECQFCDKTYATQATLEKHIQKFHPETGNSKLNSNSSENQSNTNVVNPEQVNNFENVRAIIKIDAKDYIDVSPDVKYNNLEEVVMRFHRTDEEYTEMTRDEIIYFNKALLKRLVLTIKDLNRYRKLSITTLQDFLFPTLSLSNKYSPVYKLLMNISGDIFDDDDEANIETSENTETNETTN